MIFFLLLYDQERSKMVKLMYSIRFFVLRLRETGWFMALVLDYIKKICHVHESLVFLLSDI